LTRGAPNSFTIGAITRKKKKGVAFMPVTVPNPGTLALAGGGATAARTASGPAAGKAVANPGTVQLTVKSKKKKLAKRNSTGKAAVTPGLLRALGRV
jgi:hypothetical protein